MVTLLLLTLLQVPSAPAQPAPAKPAPTQPAPTTPTAPAAPKPRPAATAPATTTALLFVTDRAGAPIENVTVSLSGPVEREIKSPASGPTRVPGLRPGTYRVRFAREGFITFEKELVWRAGTAAPETAVTLNAAPAPPPAPPPPPPPPAAAPPAPEKSMLPPPGTPKTMGLPDFIESNFIGTRDAHKESIVGCSGVGQALVWQVREPWDGRQHPAADAMFYVVGGEGTLKMGGGDISLSAGTFAVVPRGTTYGFTRRGRNPLIVLAVLSGAPCAG
jgi:hypothetical protein